MPFVLKDGLKNYKIPTERCRGQDFFNSLPAEDGQSICKSLYSNEVVKLTIQIADPNVMEIQKDVSVTFPDMLGIVGKMVSETILSTNVNVTFIIKGGTIGLFTGLSIISVVETVYWIGKVHFCRSLTL